MLTSGTEFKNAALRMRVQQKCTPATTAGLVLNGAVNTTHAGTGEVFRKASIFLSLWKVLSPKAVLCLKARKLTSCCHEEVLNEQDGITRLLLVCIGMIFIK